MSGPSAKVIAPRVAAIRELAAKAGRNPAEILMFSMFTVILGRTRLRRRPNMTTTAATSAPKAR
jgi:alkanesulfonate monooxygenase SsuD/methylene tetrahydromethanopterin reductase-like flavin-dependent oxidoreductase (luciferase family)